MSKKKNVFNKLYFRYNQFKNSLYSRILLIIAILSGFLLISYQVIFRTVNDVNLKTVISQNGHNIGSIVEGALYLSMLENNKAELQNTLDIINTLPGIDDVSMYDSNDKLAYSSFTEDDEGHINPNCMDCHASMDSIFPEQGRSYKIINVNSDCQMGLQPSDQRHLMIHSPIINQPSCYQNTACHAHQPTERILGSLVIQLPLNEFDISVHQASNKFTLLAIIITILVASILVWVTSRNIRKPLAQVIDASKTIASGDNSIRIETKPNQLSELRTLSLAFNHMMDNLEQANMELQNWTKQMEYKVQKKSEELGEIQNELINIERKASLGRLSSSVAHELNNPLSGILVYAKLVSKKLKKLDGNQEELKSSIEHLSMIESETKRCGDIVKGLLDFSRKDQQNFENKHLHEILTETFLFMQHPLSLENISFEKKFTANQDVISCCPNQIKQIFVALLVNASQAISENGEIIISTHVPDENTIAVSVTDNGIGMDPGDIPHIFEPFFTTKHHGEGLGLGLAIVHGIVRNHKGKISVKSAPGEGTTIKVNLPLQNTEEV